MKELHFSFKHRSRKPREPSGRQVEHPCQVDARSRQQKREFCGRVATAKPRSTNKQGAKQLRRGLRSGKTLAQEGHVQGAGKRSKHRQAQACLCIARQQVLSAACAAVCARERKHARVFVFYETGQALAAWRVLGKRWGKWWVIRLTAIVDPDPSLDGSIMNFCFCWRHKAITLKRHEGKIVGSNETGSFQHST